MPAEHDVSVSGIVVELLLYKQDKYNFTASTYICQYMHHKEKKMQSIYERNYLKKYEWIYTV